MLKKACWTECMMKFEALVLVIGLIQGQQKGNTGQKLQFSPKEICRKYYRIDPDFIQCARNLALSYSISYKFPKPEI